MWIVSNQQLFAWVQKSMPLSQLGDVEVLKCPTPRVSQKICSEMPDNEAGLLHCHFSDFPWSTSVSFKEGGLYLYIFIYVFADLWWNACIDDSLLTFLGGSVSASLHMVSLCFPCSMHGSGLAFQ